MTKNKNGKKAGINTQIVYEYYKKHQKDFIEFQESLKESKCKNKLFNNSITNYTDEETFIKDFIESFYSFGIQLRNPKRNGEGFIRLDETKNRIKIRFMKTAKNYDNYGLKDSIKNMGKCLYFLYHSKKLSTMAFKRVFFDYNTFDIHHIDNNNRNDAIENLLLLTKKAHNKIHSKKSE